MFFYVQGDAGVVVTQLPVFGQYENGLGTGHEE
jgi:hypothetical protein